MGNQPLDENVESTSEALTIAEMLGATLAGIDNPGRREVHYMAS